MEKLLEGTQTRFDDENSVCSISKTEDRFAECLTERESLIKPFTWDSQGTYPFATRNHSGFRKQNKKESQQQKWKYWEVQTGMIIWFNRLLKPWRRNRIWLKMIWTETGNSLWTSNNAMICSIFHYLSRIKISWERTSWLYFSFACLFRLGLLFRSLAHVLNWWTVASWSEEEVCGWSTGVSSRSHVVVGVVKKISLLSIRRIAIKFLNSWTKTFCVWIRYCFSMRHSIS